MPRSSDTYWLITGVLLIDVIIALIAIITEIAKIVTILNYDLPTRCHRYIQHFIAQLNRAISVSSDNVKTQVLKTHSPSAPHARTVNASRVN